MKFNLEKICLKAVKTGVFLALLTPLVLLPYIFSPVRFAKTIFFRTVIEVLFIFYILLIFTNRRYLPKARPLFFSVLAFFGIFGLAVLASINPFRSFWGTMVRCEGYVTLLHLWAFFLILIGVFQKREEWLKILRFSVIVSFLVSVTAFIQKFFGVSFYGVEGTRLTGTLGNPDFLAPYLVLNIFLAIFLLVTDWKRKKLIWICLALFNFYILILTQTRGAWVGAGAGALLLFILWFPAILKKITARKVFVLLLLLLFLFSLVVVFNQSRFNFIVRPIRENVVVRRFTPIWTGSGGQMRPVLWGIAIQAWREKPVLGWGPEMFAYVYDKYLKAEHFQYYELERMSFDRPHSMVFCTLVSTGLLGLLAYLGLFITALFVLWNYKKQGNRAAKTILFSLLLAHFVQELFIFETISSYLVFFLLLAFLNNNFSPSPRNYNARPHF